MSTDHSVTYSRLKMTEFLTDFDTNFSAESSIFTSLKVLVIISISILHHPLSVHLRFPLPPPTGKIVMRPNIKTQCRFL